MTVERWVDYVLVTEESVVQIHIFNILKVNIPEKKCFGCFLDHLVPEASSFNLLSKLCYY